MGDMTFNRALLDLGASINLIPTTLYNQFGFRELTPTLVTIQLADRSVKTPKGVVEDVIVWVKDFYFPVDFLVLDMEVPEKLQNAPIILGRPFLATAKANIDCDTGCMEIAFEDRKMQLDIFQVTKSFDCDCVEEHDPVEPLVEE